MDLTKASRLCEDLLEEQGLSSIGWTFEFSNAKVTFGTCDERKKIIELSPYLVALNTEDEVMKVILHELAHALAGIGQHHNTVWRLQCRVLGIKPERTYNPHKVKTLRNL